MKVTRFLREVYKDVNSVKLFKAIIHPRKAYVHLERKVWEERARARKDQMDYEREHSERPKRLAKILPSTEEELRKYQKEIDNDEVFYERFDKRKSELKSADEVSGSTGKTDAQTMYVVCRSIKPEIVVETGVKYGSFDAHILRALDRNGRGKLHSIDLPDPPKFGFGYLIPEELRQNWNLHLGDASEILQNLLNELEEIDVFLHDSSHTPEHMLWEYETSYPFIRSHGILASHDILMTNSYQEFVNKKKMQCSQVANVGIAVK